MGSFGDSFLIVRKGGGQANSWWSEFTCEKTSGVLFPFIICWVVE